MNGVNSILNKHWYWLSVFILICCNDLEGFQFKIFSLQIHKARSVKKKASVEFHQFLWNITRHPACMLCFLPLHLLGCNFKLMLLLYKWYSYFSSEWPFNGCQMGMSHWNGNKERKLIWAGLNKEDKLRHPI